MTIPFTFKNSLQGKNFPSQSDQFGLQLSPILPADGSQAPPGEGVVENSLAILGPLQGAGGGPSAPGYVGIAIQPSLDSAWVNQQDLSANDVAVTATAGPSGFNGNTCVFGYGNDSLNPKGSAWVFVRSQAGAWSIQQQLVPTDGAPQGNYGAACCVFGNIAIVVSATGAGPAIYAFLRSGNTWTQVQQFQPAVASTVVLGVGAMTANQLFITGIDQVSAAGSVFVYTLQSGLYQLTQTLTQGGSNDEFGVSVSCDGNTLVIGGGFTTTGKAYVYTNTGGVWALFQTLVGADSVNGDLFGSGVSVDGTLMVVGAYHATVNAVADAGTAYVFLQSGGAWTQFQKISAPVPTASSYYGFSVASFAGTPSWAVVGAPFIGSVTTEGTVFFFEGPQIAPLADPFVTLTFKGQKVYR